MLTARGPLMPESSRRSYAPWTWGPVSHFVLLLYRFKLFLYCPRVPLPCCAAFVPTSCLQLTCVVLLLLLLPAAWVGLLSAKGQATSRQVPHIMPPIVLPNVLPIVPPGHTAGVDDEVLDMMLSEMDGDHDGRVNYTEFVVRHTLLL